MRRARRSPVAAPSSALSHLPGEEGIVAGISTLLEWTRRGAASMLDQRLHFGPVFKTQFGLEPIVAVTDPKLILDVVRNEQGAFSAALTWGDLFAGLGAARARRSGALEVEPSREERDALEAAFGAAAMAGYLEASAPIFERAVDRWLGRRRVAFKAEVRRVLAQVAARTLLGVDDPTEAEALDRATADMWMPPLAVLDDRRLRPAVRLASRRRSRLRDALIARVPERRASAAADLFSRMCRGACDAVPDARLVRIFTGIAAGAFETMASGVASVGYLLAKHPHWQDRLRSEALALGKARLTYIDAERLHDAECVWKETLRLFPVMGTLPRAALRVVELGPWRLPEGAVVFALFAPALRDYSHWSDPERFHPERFAEPRSPGREDLIMPFGAGPHAHFGLALANAGVKCLLFSMLTRCRFRLERDYVARHTMAPVGTVSGDVALSLEPLR